MCCLFIRLRRCFCGGFRRHGCGCGCGCGSELRGCRHDHHQNCCRPSCRCNRCN